MHGSTHKWFVLLLLFAFLSVVFPASAQGEVTLDSVTVQLWPEFDQPTMLVILNIHLASDVSLPAELTFQLPGNVDKPFVVAVGPTAQSVSDQDINYSYKKNGDRLELAVTAEFPAIQIEYYDSNLIKQGENRSFNYVWPGTYAADALNVSFRVPVDTTDITTDPEMRSTTGVDGEQTFLEWGTGNLDAGKQIPISISYDKTSEQLGMSGPLETGTVDENTEGRVSLSNYLPYILGVLGILLILVAGLYFWQTSKGKSESRKRHRSRDEDSDGGDVYCHQCGQRAQAGDRFCRTCGTRLRRET